MKSISPLSVAVALVAAVGFLFVYLGVAKPVMYIPLAGEMGIKEVNLEMLPFVKWTALAGLILAVLCALLPLNRLALLTAGLLGGLMVAVAVLFYRELQPLTELPDAEKVLKDVKILPGVYWLSVGTGLSVLGSLCLPGCRRK